VTQPRDPDPEVLGLFEEYARTGDRSIRNELITRHRWIAVYCASRFARRSVPTDDLVQVAQIGVLKAVERFDPDYGVPFPTFAMPTVLGELRRHFRDATWMVNVARRHKDLCLEVGAATERLAQRLGRLPSAAEIAADLQLPIGEVLEAMEAGESYWPTSFERSFDGQDGSDTVMAEIADLLGADHASATEASLVARSALRLLPDRERQIVYLRFFEELTQQEIADVMGISQVHVSRLLRSALLHVRETLGVSQPAN
jgi:RNA polymerase sigma-B factor